MEQASARRLFRRFENPTRSFSARQRRAGTRAMPDAEGPRLCDAMRAPPHPVKLHRRIYNRRTHTNTHTHTPRKSGVFLIPLWPRGPAKGTTTARALSHTHIQTVHTKNPSCPVVPLTSVNLPQRETHAGVFRLDYATRDISQVRA